MRALQMTGDEQRQIGLSLVSLNAGEFVDRMREYARDVCSTSGVVTTDELREYAERIGISPHHRNAWGAVFRRPEFRPVGYRPSRLPSNRARVIRVWALA